MRQGKRTFRICAAVATVVLGLTSLCHAGLLSYWPLDEGTGTTAYNTQAGMPNATLVNTEAADWVVGHDGTGFAVRLNEGGGDPLNEHINFGTHAAIDALRRNFSLQSWVRTNDTGGWFRTIVSKYGLVGSQTPFWGLGWMGTSGNPLGFYVRDSSGASVTTSAPSGTWGKDNLWHQFIGVIGSRNITLYGDGEVLQTVADTLGATITTAGRVLSSGTHNLSQYVREEVDDVAVWNHALSPLEARLLFTGAYTPLTLPTSFSPNFIQQAVPAAYWRLEETITGGGAGDWSGNDYHLNGFGTFTAKGVARPLTYDPDNRAMWFDGSSSYLSNRAAGTSQPIGAAILATDFAGDGPYSIELWFNADVRKQATLVGMSTAGSSSAPLIAVGLEADGRISFTHGSTTLYSSQTYNAGKWHYLAAVMEGPAMKLYLDGILDPNTAADTTTISGSLDVAIGRYARDLSQRYFDGLLDEIALYDRALSAQQVMEHFVGVPEPATLSLLALGGLGLLRRRRRAH